MPVVSLPHDSVIVLLSSPLPMALTHGRQRIQPDARRGTGSDNHRVVVPEDVVLLRQQVRHRVTGRNVGHKPERVLQVGQQAHVRIGKRWPRAGLQVLHRRGHVAAADDVQPLLHIALVFELGLCASARCLEKCVEIELIELAGAGDGQQFVRHLVGQQAHLRHCAVRVPLVRMLCREFSPGALFVGVRPVEDLLLDKLARRQRPERRAGEVEVRPARDRQELGLLR